MTKNVETSDIILAATPKVSGYDLNRIEKVGTRGVFYFEGVKINDLTKYDLGQFRVEPNNFNNAVRSLTTAARRVT